MLVLVCKCTVCGVGEWGSCSLEGDPQWWTPDILVTIHLVYWIF